MLQLSTEASNKFMLETSWSTRHYLENHPEKAAQFAQLTSEGRFEQLGAGENIIDTNLVHGELLLRNMALGCWWSEEVLGARPSSGYYRDAFGTSAQVPQIFRQCGLPWIAHLDYNLPDNPYWRGLDGSTVYYLHPQHKIPFTWACAKGKALGVCLHCQGFGCDSCEQRGYEIGQRSDFNYQPTEHWQTPAVIFLIGNEENMPGLHVAAEIADFNSRQNDFYAQQAIYQDVEKYIQDELAMVDNPPAEMLSSKVENNPCITGVYVTRIKIKQQHRAIEHKLIAAECWNALLGNNENAAELRAIWRNLTFSAFHDAITSTMCDDGYYELLDLQQSMTEKITTICQQILLPQLTLQSSTATIFNHQGFAASAPITISLPKHLSGASVICDGECLPLYSLEKHDDSTSITFQSPEIAALSAKSVTIFPAEIRSFALDERKVQCGRFSLTAGEHGIEDVTDTDYGSVTDTHELLFGELVLEEDIGDPWSTRSFSHKREKMAQYTTLRDIHQECDSITIRYSGAHPSMGVFGPWDPMIIMLKWQQSFHLRAGSPWLEVATAVEWFCYNRRLRLAFPSNTTADRGIYEIPYGVLERDRYEATTDEFINPDGDWPAIHWAGIQAPDYTFAIFNQGTPSYRVEDGKVLVSLLRSPVSPGGLLQPNQYIAHNFATITDHGSHHFLHALFLGEGDWRNNNTMQQATLFNSGFSVQPGVLTSAITAWQLQAQHTMLTTVKSAENGKGLILRLVEHAGLSEDITLNIPAKFHQAELCNLLEDKQENIPVNNGQIKLKVKPNKIITIRVMP